MQIQFPCLPGLYELIKDIWDTSSMGHDLHKVYVLIPLVICWGLWRIRTQALYDNRTPDSAQAIFYALDLLTSISITRLFKLFPNSQVKIQCFGGLRYHTRRQHIELLTWEKPSLGTFKLNVDGSSLGNPGE